MPWALDSADTRLLRRAAKLDGLPTLEKRRPVRLLDLTAMAQGMDAASPAHCAIWAASLFAFFAMCRPGEVSVRNLKASTAERARWSDFSEVASRGRNKISSIVLRLPSEKVRGSAGMDRIVAQQRQMESLCPVQAVRRHWQCNFMRDGEDA
ncbi:hypothetical protein OC835_007579, partial [Tilletia horrida]